ncbi:MAG: hypothetical protein OK474_00450 [Thaumarchaeota archaeon]|nr:hypothetical protein [Nitrososphaerota archaeon]
MSAKWMSKVHARAPMTWQEEEVKELLEVLHMNYAVHVTFQVGTRLMVPDFFLPKLDLVIECWRSDSRRGVALGWAERNALYVNLKFRRLKAVHPKMRCLGLAEFPQVDLESLRQVVGDVMPDADFMAYSMEEFESAMKSLLGV